MVLGRTHIPVVDHDRCQSCRVCLRECPGEFSPSFRADEHTVRGYVYAHTALSASQQLPPCEAACPLGQKVREYLRLVHQGRYMQAMLAILEDNPLPGVLGHVCHRPCEQACLKGSWNSPVAIRELKRFVAGWAGARRAEVLEALAARKRAGRGRAVAVVGAGPAGLGCAFELLMAGCKVVVYDRLGRPGGMLRVGIPEFRLPQQVVDGDIELLGGLGMEFRGGLSLGRELELEELKQGYDAVVLALGAWRDRRLGVEGEGGEGCMGCVEFLSAVREGRINRIEGRVVVVGGGNAALDGARVALRLGAREVELAYRRRREDMPADAGELEEGLREGIKLLEQVQPVEVLRQGGRVRGLKLAKTRAGQVDSTGRPRPEVVEDSELVREAQLVIVAIGQDPEPFQGQAGEGVFMAGDMVQGPSTVAQAVGSGRRVAREVLAWLGI